MQTVRAASVVLLSALLVLLYGCGRPRGTDVSPADLYRSYRATGFRQGDWTGRFVRLTFARGYTPQGRELWWYIDQPPKGLSILVACEFEPDGGPLTVDGLCYGAASGPEPYVLVSHGVRVE
jgi:hypothetical protein